MEKLGLQEPHYRRSARSVSHSSGDASSAPTHDPRCLPELTLSTPAFLAVCSRMATPLRKKESHWQVWATLLATIWKVCLPRDFHILVCMSLDFKVGQTTTSSSSSSSDDRFVRLHCRGGVFQLGEVAGRGGVRGALVRLCGPTPAIQDLLLRLDTTRYMNLFAQFVLQLGLTIEKTLVSSGGADITISVTQALKQSRRASMKLAQALVKRLESDRKGMYYKYFMTSRKYFSNAKHLSYTCDASRVGRRQCLVGTVSLLSNIMAWCPPQALSSWGTAHRAVVLQSRAWPRPSRTRGVPAAVLGPTPDGVFRVGGPLSQARCDGVCTELVACPGGCGLVFASMGRSLR